MGSKNCIYRNVSEKFIKVLVYKYDNFNLFLTFGIFMIICQNHHLIARYFCRYYGDSAVVVPYKLSRSHTYLRNYNSSNNETKRLMNCSSKLQFSLNMQ